MIQIRQSRKQTRWN